MSEAATQASIDALEIRIKILKSEVTRLKGRIKNRNPARIAVLAQECTALKAQVERLQRCFFATLLEPSDPLQLECLRKSAIDFFTQSNIDQELWKNIAY